METLIRPDMGMRLLLVPALMNKIIAVMFIHFKLILFDAEEKYTTLCVDDQHKDELYFITDYQSP